MISHLLTQAHLPYGGEAAIVLTNTITLSYFRSLFNDHKRPFVYYVEQVYYVKKFIILKNFVCFNKYTKTFSNFLIFLKLYFYKFEYRVSFIAFKFLIYNVNIRKLFYNSK